MPTDDFVPNQDVLFGPTPNASGVPNNTAGQRYQNVNEVTLNTADYVQMTGTGAMTHNWRANIGSGNLTGKTIMSVEVLIDAAQTSGSNGRVRASLNINGVDYDGSTLSLTGSVVRRSWSWALNPSTDDPWTIADLEALDTTDHIVTRLDTTSASPNTRRAYRYTFRVHWEAEGWGAIPVGF